MKHIKEFLVEALGIMEESAKTGQEQDRAQAARRSEAEHRERRESSDKVAQGRQS